MTILYFRTLQNKTNFSFCLNSSKDLVENSFISVRNFDAKISGRISSEFVEISSVTHREKTMQMHHAQNHCSLDRSVGASDPNILAYLFCLLITPKWQIF